MLQSRSQDIDSRLADDIRTAPDLPSAFDFDRLLAAARRQWPIVLAIAILFGLVGVVRILTAVPLYSAETQVLIDRTAGQVADEYSLGVSAGQDDTTTQSQVELMRSERVALMVVDKLGLAADDDFLFPATGPVGHLRSLVEEVLVESGWMAGAAPVIVEDVARRRMAVGRLLGNVRVNRVPRTFVLALSYTSPDPALAARVANAWAEAYLTNALESKYDATRRASSWLGERIEELRQQSIAADLDVQEFRSANDLIAAEGNLASDQRLGDLNQQLIDAQQEVRAAGARYQQVSDILDSGNMDRAVRESLDSGIMNLIRTRYLDGLKLYNNLVARLGDDHVQVVRLKDEMEENRRLMFSELGRIAETLRSDLELAQKREAAVSESLAAATEESRKVNEKLVQLRELERNSETYRTLYQSFLARYQEAVQQREFPVSEAIVIAEATPPSVASYPNRKSILAQFLMLGLLAGGGLGAFREYRDRFFRTGDQVRDELGQKFLGLAPKVTAAGNPAAVRRAEDEANARSVIKRSTIFNQVVDHPLSSFAETMRSAKIAADLLLEGRSPKIIGVVSSLPGEGKSTVSANFAALLAAQGSRTLLIDADLRNPGLTRGMAAHAKRGIVEGVLEGRALSDLVLTDPDTGLEVLPAVVKRSMSHSSDLLASAGMGALLDQAREGHDYVVIDLPPLAPVVDAVAIAPKVDAFIFVVEWGKTSRRMVRSILSEEPLIAERTLGVVLNKADIGRMKYYQEYGSKDYYYGKYSSYYHSNAKR